MIVTESMARGMISSGDRHADNDFEEFCSRQKRRKYSTRRALKSIKEFYEKATGDRYLMFEDDGKFQTHLYLDGRGEWLGFTAQVFHKKKLTRHEYQFPVYITKHTLARLTQYNKKVACKELMEAVAPITNNATDIYREKSGNYYMSVPDGIFYAEIGYHCIMIKTFIQKDKLDGWKKEYFNKLSFENRDYYLKEIRNGINDNRRYSKTTESK